MPATILTILALLSLIGSTLATAQGATGQLDLTVVDNDTGQPVPCRMHLAGPNSSKPRKVEKVPFWQDHFVFPGKIMLKSPLGNYTFVIERGLEYLDQSGHFTFEPFADDSKQVELHRFADMAAEGWWSGDLDIRRPPADIELLVSADDLHVAEVITWSNSKKGAASERGQPPAPFDSKKAKQAPVRFDGNRYYDLTAASLSTPGGEVLVFHLPAPLKAPADHGEYPPLAKYIGDAKEKEENVWVDVARPFYWDLPVLVALGQVDSVQVAHGDLCRETVLAHETGGKPRDKVHYPNPFGNPLWSQFIYFQLLECGLRIPPSAGSASGLAPNPVGYNRMYVHVDGDFTYEKWWQSFRAGAVVVTNGPLMRPTVEGELPGHVFQAEAGTSLDLEIGLTLSTRDPISYLEIVKDGEVADSIRFDEYAKTGKLPHLKFDHSGWFLLRAINDVGKTFHFAMTGPYYVEIGYKPRISKKAARFFLDWIDDRSKQIKLEDPEQKSEVLDLHRKARDYWQEILSKANAD